MKVRTDLGSSGLAAGQVASNQTGTVVITAPLNNINYVLAAASGLMYHGFIAFSGSDTLTITANDLGNSGPGGSNVATANVAITVTNTTPTFGLTTSARYVHEGIGAATFTVQRLGSQSGTALVSYATRDATAIGGSDYFGQSGTLEFANNETSKSLQISITNDGFVESDEFFYVGLTSSPGGAIDPLANSACSSLSMTIPVPLSSCSVQVMPSPKAWAQQRCK